LVLTTSLSGTKKTGQAGRFHYYLLENQL